MIYGYARCSTNETKQDINRQVRELKAAGAEEVYLEYEHGDAAVKAEQLKLFSIVNEGDTIIVLEVPRLARSTKQTAAAAPKAIPAMKNTIIRRCSLS